jgi:hypothetical protein
MRRNQAYQAAHFACNLPRKSRATSVCSSIQTSRFLGGRRSLDKQFLQRKTQLTPSAQSPLPYSALRKEHPMKTSLLLHDETNRAMQLLQDAVSTKVPFGEIKAVAGCNCDRWGHPWPGCDERKIPPKAKPPITVATRK